MSEPLQSKLCRKCEQICPLSDFGLDRKTKDGHKSRCRKCIAEENKSYQDNNKPVVLAAKRRYRMRHAAALADYQRQYRARARGFDLASRVRKANERIALKTGELTSNQLIANPDTLRIEKLLLTFRSEPDSTKGKRAYREAKSLAIKIKMKYDIFAALAGNTPYEYLIR